MGTGHRPEDNGYRPQDTGHRIKDQDIGYGIYVTGHWIEEIGNRIQAHNT